MTAIATPASSHETAETIAIEEWRPSAAARALDQRRAAFMALNRAVQRLLPRLALTSVLGDQPLTIYEAIYPATPAIGGYWTVAVRRFGPFSHAIASYTVSLAFDDEQRPAHFVIEGARSVTTADASPAALVAGIAAARAAGPLRTAALHAFQGFAL